MMFAVLTLMITAGQQETAAQQEAVGQESLVEPRKNLRSNREKHSNTSGAPIDGVILC